MKEKSICSSVGLKVRDSAAPLSFLRDPDPTMSLALTVSATPVTNIVPEPT